MPVPFRSFRLGRWPRLLVAATCLLLALASAVSAHPSGADEPRVAVVVAARNLPAGHVLRGPDLRVARWPAVLRPVTAQAGPTSLLGRRLVSPVAAREPVTSARVLGHGLTAGLPAELVAAPVLIEDGHAADLLQAGERADLLSVARAPDPFDSAPAPTPRVTTVVRAALVLAVYAASDSAGTEIVLAVDRSVAVTISRDAATHVFTALAAPP